MDFNIFYGMYGYEKKDDFKSLAEQYEVEYIKEEKEQKEIKDIDSFVSQEMLNAQLDLDVPKCKYTRH